MALDGQVVGAVGGGRYAREGVREVIRQLTEVGIGQTTMLTGDNERVAAAIAAEAGLDGTWRT